MNNPFEQEKKNYDATPIPEELGERVQAGIAEGRKRAAARRRFRSLAGVAACMVLMIGALNVSPAFAAAAAEVPVVGGVFRVLTVRNYQETNDDRTLTVEQPVVEGESALADRINAEIDARVAAKTAEGEQAIADYKEAFLATGGTEEQWAQHDNKVTVTYDVKSQRDGVLSFSVTSDVSFAAAYRETVYYNLDMNRDAELTLADVLGEDWVNLCNDAIRAEIAKAPDNYFAEDMGGFTTVDDTTAFYINENGLPVVVFPAYTVAPGFMGDVEFVIG